ncbi:MAG: S24 family peptidase [Marmoricola sp.]
MRWSRRWGLAVVTGDSMRPTLLPGDRLLVQYGARPAPGLIVQARFPDGTLVVKRVARAQETASGRPGWYLLSEDPEVGVDSRHRGPVPEADVLAVVRLRVAPWPARLPRR